MALTCTVVAQSGSDGRHPAAICTRFCRRLQTDRRKKSGRRKLQEIWPADSAPRAARLEQRKSKLDIASFFPRLRPAVGGDPGRQSHNEKNPSF